jgi:hypothetical protein
MLSIYYFLFAHDQWEKEKEQECQEKENSQS